MKWSVIAVIVMFAFSFIWQFYTKKKTQRILDELSTLLYEGKLTEFYDRINDKDVTRNIYPFNIDYMKLNAAILEDNKGKVKDCIDHFEKVHLNSKQIQAVYLRAFNYYVFKEDKKGAKFCYNKLEKEVYPEKGDVDRIYSIFVEDKTEYLDEVLEEYENAAPEAKLNYIPTLLKLYENKGDTEKIKEYTNLLKEAWDAQISEEQKAQ